jgi:phytoene desaturase
MARALVIGGGLAGLSAAIALASRGHGVSLLEAEPEIGGKARAVPAGGVHVDVGPTILTDLAPLRQLLHAAGAEISDTVALERLDPGLLAVFPGGRRLALHADPARLAAELEPLGPAAAADWERLMDLGARAARLADHYYARGDVGGARDLVSFALAGSVSLRDLLPFARRNSFASLLAATIRTAELRRLLAHFARFVGLDAGAAPAVVLFIPYLFATSGVWHPRGGVSTLAASLASLATKLGADIERGDSVSRLEIGAGRVIAAVTGSGRRVPADVFVSAVDVLTLARWVPDGTLGRRTRRLEPALAARVAWWVLSAPPRLPHHHVFHFPATREAEPLYVATPGVTDPGLAPRGGTVLYALEHGEPGRLQRDGFADELRLRLEAAGQWPGGQVLGHGVAGGAGSAYGYRIGRGLLSGFRPSQRVPRLPNLFLAGASVFPGPGVANVIRSGWRAAALADEAATGGRR